MFNYTRPKWGKAGETEQAKRAGSPTFISNQQQLSIRNIDNKNLCCLRETDSVGHCEEKSHTATPWILPLLQQNFNVYLS